MIASRFRSSGAALLLALFVCGTYPLALVGQLSADTFMGDALFLRELTYGSQRLLAGRLLEAWLLSLPWVAVFWLVQGSVLWAAGRLYALLGPVLAVLVIVSERIVVLPPIFAWLMLATFVLQAALAVSFRKVD